MPEYHRSKKNQTLEIKKHTRYRANKQQGRIKVTFIIVVSLLTLSYVAWEFFADKNIETNVAYIEGERHTLISAVHSRVKSISVIPGEVVEAQVKMVSLDQRDLKQQRLEILQQQQVLDVSLQLHQQQLQLLDRIITMKNEEIKSLEAGVITAGRTLKRQDELGSFAIEREKENAMLAVSDRQKIYHESEESLWLTLLKKSEHEAGVKELSLLSAQLKQKQDYLNSQEQDYNISLPYPVQVHEVHASSGAIVKAGEPLLTITHEKNFWITAYFKETELKMVPVGTKVAITIDAYTKDVFFGEVSSISSLAGAALSASTPNYSAGNFTRIVQRIPVKITFDSYPSIHLAIGLSVHISVIK